MRNFLRLLRYGLPYTLEWLPGVMLSALVGALVITARRTAQRPAATPAGAAADDAAGAPRQPAEAGRAAGEAQQRLDEAGRKAEQVRAAAESDAAAVMRRAEESAEKIALEILIGGPDQRVVALIRNGEDDAAVGILEDVGMIVREQPRHDDVATQAQPAARTRRAAFLLNLPSRGVAATTS